MSKKMFIRPRAYVGFYDANGDIDTAKTITIPSDWFTDDAIEEDVTPILYENATPAGTTSELTGINEGHTVAFSLKIPAWKFAAVLNNEFEAATYANAGDDGRWSRSKNGECPVIQDCALVIVDECENDSEKDTQVWHCQISAADEALTYGAPGEPVIAHVTAYGQFSDTNAVIEHGVGSLAQRTVFDPATFTYVTP